MIKGIGINSHGGTIDGNLEKFKEEIMYYSECGFDYIELAPHGLDVILNGELNFKRVEETRQILNQFALKYTVHAPNDLNLGDFKRKDIQYRIFEACIEFTSLIGADLIVYHSGVRMPYEEDYDLERIVQIEASELKELAQKAAKKGIQIAVENANPTPREIFSGKNHSYGSCIKKLTDQIKSINEDNVGICLDFGHAYLAAKFYKYDFFEAIEYAAPYVNHFHIHDNFGKVMSSNRPYMYLYPFGEDDLHLPIGWGEIPYNKIFSSIDFPRPKVLVFELKPRYFKEAKECIVNVKKMLNI